MYHKITFINTPETKIARGICWGLIFHRPLAKFKVYTGTTVFWLTETEREEFQDILEGLKKEK